jgi:hypothetical protein
MRLIPQVIVFATGRFVIFRSDNELVTVELSNDSPIERGSTIMPALQSEAKLPLDNQAQIQLMPTLLRLGWLSDASPISTLPFTRLADFLTQVKRGNAEIARGLTAVTADEALIIPDGASNKARRVALRFFLSRIDSFRLKAYSALLGDEKNIFEIWGDYPEERSWLSLDSTCQAAQALGAPEPVSVSLGRSGSRWQVTSSSTPGTAPSACSTQTSDTTRPDRLAVVGGLTHNFHQLEADGTGIWIATADYALPNLNFTTPPPDRRPIPRWSTGVDVDRGRASIKALAEGVERFAMGDPRMSDLRYCAAQSLEGQWLDPRAVARYGRAQRERLGLAEFLPSDPEWWVAGQRGDGQPIWLPAALIFCPFGRPASWLAAGFASSNGAAAHTLKLEAIENSWLELLERDAFMRTYLRAVPPPKLALSLLTSASRAMHTHVTQVCDAAGAFLMESTIGVPVVGYAAWNDGRLCLGAAARLETRAAIEKAMSEVYLQLLHPFDNILLDVSKVIGPEDHGRLYAASQYSSRLLWLLDGREVSADMLGGPTQSLTGSWRSRSMPYFYHKQLGDWHVVKCLDPALIHLTFGYDNELLGHPAVISALGGKIADSPLVPHPFA